MKKLIVPLLLCASICASDIVLAQGYPTKPIKVVVPYTPGGSVDNTCRLLTDQLQKQLGQPVIIENKPGASGSIGSLEVMRAAPDGYTLLCHASSQVYLPLVVKRKTYDAEKDFTSIAQIGYVPLVVVTYPKFEADDLQGLVALAQKSPGKYTWSTSGLGTSSHLSEEMLNRGLKMNMEIISYKGAVPQLTDVMGGHVTAAISPMPGVSGFIRSGHLKVLAVTGDKRMAALPNIPTVAESGLPGFEMYSWYGLWGPANLPEAVLNKLSTEVAIALKNKGVRDRMGELDFEPSTATQAQFVQIVKDEIAKIGAVAREANISLD
ncbi:MAG: tripartite tricarboxylate transporter substrate binding protein [Burkholderiales bacterium]